MATPTELRIKAFREASSAATASPSAINLMNYAVAVRNVTQLGDGLSWVEIGGLLNEVALSRVP